jgi:choline-sulfatase
MTTTPQNPLVLMSDEHNRKIAGHAGHPDSQHTGAGRACCTRKLFHRCLTPSPICVPARASLATGRPVHGPPRLGQCDRL